MVIATFFFWAGRNKMVHVPPAGLGYLKETFSREGLLTLARIAMVYFFILFFWALWGMSNGVEWTLQAEKMDLHWMGMDLIAAQVQTANPILILIFIPMVNYVIYPAIDRVFPLTPLRKIGIGLFSPRLSFVVIVWIQGQIDSGLKPSINWQLARLRHTHAWRSDGFDHWIGIFLYAGAEFDEELGYGLVASDCRLGRTFRRLGQ